MLQDQGCYALGWLADDAEIRKQIDGNGGVAAVLAAMNTHSDNAEVANQWMLCIRMAG